MLEPPAIVRRDTEQGEQVLERLQAIVKQQQLSTFEVAELLYTVDRNDLWAIKGHESLDDWAAKTDLDIGIREIRYLISVHKKSTAMSIPKNQLVAAKISKLKIIFQLDPTAEVVDTQTGEVESMDEIIRLLIKEAPHKTLKEIKQIVQDLLNKGKEEDEQITWLNLCILRSAKHVVEDALELARVNAGSSYTADGQTTKEMLDSRALELICADYLSDPNNRLEELGEEGNHEDSFIEVEGERYELGDA